MNMIDKDRYWQIGSAERSLVSEKKRCPSNYAWVMLTTFKSKFKKL